MGLDRMEALEIQHRLEKPVGGGIAVERRHDIGAERVADRRFMFERVGVSLADQFGGHLRTIETLGNAVNDSRLQCVVVQDGRIDEGRKLGLAPRDLLGLATDARPYRVHLLQSAGSHLMLGHDHLPPFVFASLAHPTRRWTIPLHGKVLAAIKTKSPPVWRAPISLLAQWPERDVVTVFFIRAQASRTHISLRRALQSPGLRLALASGWRSDTRRNAQCPRPHRDIKKNR